MNKTSRSADGRSRTVDDAALVDLVRRGLVTPPLIGPGGNVPRKPVTRLETLLDELDLDREDR